MEEMNFWEHVEALRKVLFKSLFVIALLAVVFFCFMTEIFDKVILAPCFSDFYLYRFVCHLSRYVSVLPDFCNDGFQVELINIQLPSQFFIHMSTSFWLGLLFAFPYVVYQLWSFVSPALYEREKRHARFAFVVGNTMFFVGVAVGYLLVFPLTLRFLAGYQISVLIPNQISIDSYIGNFLAMIFIMGLVFELPLLSWLLSRLGLLTRTFFRKYRRHAIVALLVLAAVITPSGDPFTLMVVFLPIYMLYEISALFVRKVD
ncbi:MAG: twin-arginine translocase subunit TatC [Coprobacter sp.]|nr:twin-arginine translocase subunit TatC [Coprobacter sp.]